MLRKLTLKLDQLMQVGRREFVCFSILDGFITREVVNQVLRVITDHEYREKIVDHNYELGKAFFSYSVLRRKLRAIITNFTGADTL